MSAPRLRLATVRTSSVAGFLLLAWTMGLTIAGEFASSGAGWSLAAGVVLLVAGWVGHPDRHRMQNAMHDIAEDLDPGAEPVSTPRGDGFDEAHAPGHQHLRRH